MYISVLQRVKLAGSEGGAREDGEEELAGGAGGGAGVGVLVAALHNHLHYKEPG